MPSFDVASLSQAWPRPSRPLPIVIVGAGGIVNDGHLPAYRKAGFDVAGVFDIDAQRARETAQRWAIPRVFASLDETVAAADGGRGVVDIAVPPEKILRILEAIPADAAPAGILIQKPMGSDLAEACRIRALCRERRLVAAVNFQLRFSPMMLALRDAIARGWLGRPLELEVRLNLRTPWELFPFLRKLERVEILVHSIHYLDWIRSVLGEPRGVYARTVAHPDFPDLRSTRTSAILDYGRDVRCCLSLHHNFAFGPRHQDATIRLEGTDGAAVMSLGVLLNYPRGAPDRLEIITRGSDWTEVPLSGGWFPDAFIGTMSNLQRAAAGEDAALLTGVEDAYRTMALVEACYISDAGGGTPVPD